MMRCPPLPESSRWEGKLRDGETRKNNGAHRILRKSWFGFLLPESPRTSFPQTSISSKSRDLHLHKGQLQ